MNITGNVLEEIKKLNEFSQDIIFSDPPYNLGSKWLIGEDGKPEVKGKAVDFMNNKWNGLTGKDLESMFNDFYRILKHGGYVVFAGQMRQAMAFQYYAINSGFDMIEPIYSYSISSFPKALDVEKSLMKSLGDEGKIIGKSNNHISESNNENVTGNNTYSKYGNNKNIIESTHLIAKKYNGIKSSICPLKQTTEVWFIFRKPFKFRTIVQDIIAYEDGDSEVTISGLNIDAGRVPTSDDLAKEWNRKQSKNNDTWKGLKEIDLNDRAQTKRYPAQLFLDGAISYTREEIDLDNKDFLEFVGIDSDAINFMDKEKALDYVCQHLDKFDVSKLLDEQSGVLKSGNRLKGQGGKGNDGTVKFRNNKNINNFSGDQGGCSRILHNTSFVLQELYQHIYYSKASGYERSAGCSECEEIERESRGNNQGTRICIDCGKTDNGTNDHCMCSGEYIYKLCSSLKNNHPTLKSLKLLYNIITLFNTVDIEKAKICIPFSGVRSEKIAWLSHGALEKNITAIEINPDYVEIGEAREKFWIKYGFFFKKDKITQNKIRKKIDKRIKNKN